MKKGTKTALGVGAGLLAAGTAAAAGYYFYTSKDAKKNRKIAAQWAKDLRKEVMTRAEKLKNVDQASIAKIVDGAARAYLQARTIRKEDFLQAAQELKENWQRVAGELKSAGKKTPRKTPAKKRARKSTKKAQASSAPSSSQTS